MKATTRIYLDSFLQNIKNICFFTFLPVLIAKLGASSFEISLSNSLPPLCAAFSLAFITRQLPVTKRVYYGAGVLRQLCILSMSFSALLPHPIFWLLLFWAFNAVFVMITSVQQQALIRSSIQEEILPKMFGNTKIIGILVAIVGTYGIGKYLDFQQYIFPLNYVSTMVVGALATFTGMNLIAQLAPREKKPIRFHFVMPFKKASGTVVGISIAVFSFNLVAPLWIIYHVNDLNLTNFQIGIFAIVSGLVGTLCIPLFQKKMTNMGPKKVIFWMCIIMASTSLFYGYLSNFYVLIMVQIIRGVAFSFYDISQQTLAITESKSHENTISFFSDYQLAQNLAAGIAPFFCAFALVWLNVKFAFVGLSLLGLVTSFFVLYLFQKDSSSISSSHKQQMQLY